MPVTKRSILDTNTRSTFVINFTTNGVAAQPTGGLTAIINATADFNAINYRPGATVNNTITGLYYSIPFPSTLSISFLDGSGNRTGHIYLNSGIANEMSFIDRQYTITNPLPYASRLNGGDILIRNEGTFPAEGYATVVLEIAKNSGFRGIP